MAVLVEPSGATPSAATEARRRRAKGCVQAGGIAVGGDGAVARLAGALTLLC